MKTTVSHSEVDSANRCSRAHYYGYSLGLKRIEESDSLTRGNFGHKVLEIYFLALKEGEHPQDARVNAETYITLAIANGDIDPKLGTEVLQCVRYFWEANTFANWKIIGVEYEAVLNITESLDLPVVIDLIAEDPYGDVWVIDHKFMYDFLTTKEIEVQSQLPKYVGALRALGVKVDRAAYNILRYRNVKDSSVETRYRFQEAYLTSAQVQRVFTEQALKAVQLQEFKSRPLSEQAYLAVRALNYRVCNGCGFQSLCVAELNDTQPELVLNSEYKVRERREFKGEKSE